MNGSFDLGRILGIKVKVHWTFLLLPLWVYFSSLRAGGGASFAVVSVLFVLAIFGCVLLHEFGHALAARFYGIRTRDITLLPIGGLAALERMPRAAWQEFVIAVAGPAVNVVIALILFGGLVLATPLASQFPMVGEFFTRLAWVNVALVVFNLIPAFPMDGGRILRSALASALPHEKATTIAVTVGQVVAIGMGAYGLWSGNFMLLLIAGFVYFAGQGEKRYSQMRATNPPSAWGPPGVHQPTVAWPDLPAGANGDWSSSVPQATPPVITADVTAAHAAEWMSRQLVDSLSVFDQGQVIGFITQRDLALALENGYGAMPVGRLLGVRFG